MEQTIDYRGYKIMKIYGQEALEEFRAKQSEQSGLFLNDFHLKNLLEARNKLSEFDGLCKFIDVIKVTQELTDSGNIYYISYAYVAMEYNGVKFNPYFRHNSNNSFEFFLEESVQGEKLRYFESKLEKPNKVKKPTAKKLNDWIEYMQAIEAEKVAYVAEIDKKIFDFMDTLKPYEDQIRWSEDRHRGSMSRGGLLYTFEIRNTGGIRQEVTLDYFHTQSVFQEFLKISNNEKLKSI